MKFLDLSPGSVLWTILTFLGLLWVLKKFAWQAIIKALKEREDSIRHSFEGAQKAKDDAEKYLQEQQQMMDEIRSERGKIIRQARSEADKIISQATATSRSAADTILAEAKRQIENETRLAAHELKKEIGSLAVDIARKILNKEISETEHIRIVEESLKNFRANGQ